jgi:hypothetical protein
VTGLPSLENPSFAGPAAGPQHLSFQGRGGMYVTIGFGGDPSAADAFFPGIGFSTLLKIEPSGVRRTIADIGDYEAATTRTACRSTPTPTRCSRCRGISS